MVEMTGSIFYQNGIIRIQDGRGNVVNRFRGIERLEVANRFSTTVHRHYHNPRDLTFSGYGKSPFIRYVCVILLHSIIGASASTHLSCSVTSFSTCSVTLTAALAHVMADFQQNNVHTRGCMHSDAERQTCIRVQVTS